MELFFSSLVILLYILAHYAAEYLFVAACLFPLTYLTIAACALCFGGQGSLIAAYRKARKLLRNGVVAGGDRNAFRDVCLKGAPEPLRLAFSAFAEGSITAFVFAEKAKDGIRDRRVFILGVYFALSSALAILVFLSFYFLCPLSEAVLRFVIVLFFLSVNGAILFFLAFGYRRAAEKASVRLAILLDEKMLRVKKKEDSFSALRYIGGEWGENTDVALPKTESKDVRTNFKSENDKGDSEENANASGKESGDLDQSGTEELRAMLRELEMQLNN